MEGNVYKRSGELPWTRFFPFLGIMMIAGLALLIIMHFAGISLFGSSIVVAYSEGWISFQSAVVGLSALGITSGAAIAILSNVTVGSVLGTAAATALVDTTLLAWMGPWALLLLAAIIGIAV